MGRFQYLSGAAGFHAQSLGKHMPSVLTFVAFSSPSALPGEPSGKTLAHHNNDHCFGTFLLEKGLVSKDTR